MLCIQEKEIVMLIPTSAGKMKLSLRVDAQEPAETVRNWAYRVLLENIVHLRLPPGTFVTELELAKVLRASRTPIREALIQLSNEGFVVMTSQKGSRISLIDEKKVEEDRFTRMCLEHRVVGLACEQMTDEWIIRLRSICDMQAFALRAQDGQRFFELDEEFHQGIFASCGKERIWGVIKKFSAHLVRARRLNINSGFPVEWELVVEQHAAIVDALQRRDRVLAAQAVEIHLGPPGWDVSALKENFRNILSRSHSIILME